MVAYVGAAASASRVVGGQPLAVVCELREVIGEQTARIAELERKFG